MKKPNSLIALLAGLLIAGSTLAGERGRGMDRHHQRGGPDIGMQVMEHLGKAIRRLDLSEDQKTTIRGEFGGFRETVAPLVKEMHEGRMNLREIIAEGEYDPDAAAEIAEQQGRLTTEITLLVSETVAGVLAQLDDEQRTELQAMGEERRARKEDRRGQFKARREEYRDARSREDPDGN